MPSFLASLLVLVSTFVVGGKPADIPPFLPEDVFQRGEEISNLVKPTITPVPTPAPLIQVDEPELDIPEDPDPPDFTKVPAFNSSSEKEMPTNLPQNAVDNSQALEGVTGSGVETNTDLLDPVEPTQLYLSDHGAPNYPPPPAQDHVPPPAGPGVQNPPGKEPPFEPLN